MSAAAGGVDETVKVVQDAALAKMKEWLSTWEPRTKTSGGKAKRESIEKGSVSEILETRGERTRELKTRANPARTKPVNAWLRGSVIIE